MFANFLQIRSCKEQKKKRKTENKSKKKKDKKRGGGGLWTIFPQIYEIVKKFLKLIIDYLITFKADDVASFVALSQPSLISRDIKRRSNRGARILD